MQKSASPTLSPHSPHIRAFQSGLVLGLLGVLAFGQLLRIQLPGLGAVYPHEVILLTLLVLEFALHWQTFRSRLRNTPAHTKVLALKSFVSQHVIEVLFVGIWVISDCFLLLSQGSPLPLLYTLRLVFYLLSLLVITRVIQTKWHTKPLWLYSCAVLAILSLALYLVFPDMRFLSLFGFDDHYYRLVGTLLDPNLTGLILAAAAVTSIWLLRQKTRWTNVGVLALFSITLALTLSRSALLAFIFGLLTLLLLLVHNKLPVRRALGFSGIAMLIVVSTVLLAPKPGGEGVNLLRSSTVTSRIAFDSAQVAQPSPAQPKRTQVASSLPAIPNHAHLPNNVFAGLLVLGGPVLVICFCLLLLKYGKKIGVPLPLVGALSVLWLAHAQFNASLLEPFCLLYLGGLLFFASQNVPIGSQTQGE